MRLMFIWEDKMKKDWRDLAVTPLATQESKCTLCVLVTVLCCLDTPWPRQLLLKKVFNWGLAYSFRGSVHHHHVRERGGRQAWCWSSS